MKLDRKNTIKILAILFAAILFYALVENYEATFAFLNKISLVLTPFIIGGCLAFVINVPLNFFEKKVFSALNRKNNKTWNKVKRPLCLTISVLFSFALIAVFFVLIIPEIKRSVTILIGDLPQYMDMIKQKTMDLAERFHMSYDIIKADLFGSDIDWASISQNLIAKIKDGGASVINTTIDVTSSILSTVVNIVIGIVFSIYVLASKEKLTVQLKKIINAYIKEKYAHKIFKILSLSSETFSKFIKGQCTEALILGILCYIGMQIFGMPYALMISSIITITALVPVFGAIVGNAIGALVIFLVSPMKALWFLVYMIVLQQFEGNIIYPKVVGKSVGLPGIWVLFSVTVGGGFLGAFGMLISVPICSVIYCLFRELVAKRLKQKEETNARL